MYLLVGCSCSDLKHIRSIGSTLKGKINKKQHQEVKHKLTKACYRRSTDVITVTETEKKLF